MKGVLIMSLAFLIAAGVYIISSAVEIFYY
jgi:hypothetical protein